MQQQQQVRISSNAAAAPAAAAGGQRQLNTVLNSRQAQYPDLRYSLTGLCERSVADHFNKIESIFLEKYMRYIVLDDLMPMFFIRNSTTANQEPQSLLVSKKAFPFSAFIDELRRCLKSFSNISAQQLIIPCFGNMKIEADIREDDLMCIQCCVKITNERLRRQPENSIEMLRRTLKNEGRQLKANTRIHLVVFYNGDINFEFDKYKDSYFEERNVQLQENGQPVLVILRMLYISKVALFQHFSGRNRFIGETIDDRTITSYELMRASKREREIARQQAEKALIANQKKGGQTISQQQKKKDGDEKVQGMNSRRHSIGESIVKAVKQQPKKAASILLLSGAATISLWILLRKMLKNNKQPAS